MDPDPYTDLFQFQKGQRVHWAEHPGTRFAICQRRLRDRDVLAPVVDYLVSPVTDTGGGWVAWAYEADLEPMEDETR